MATLYIPDLISDSIFVKAKHLTYTTFNYIDLSFFIFQNVRLRYLIKQPAPNATITKVNKIVLGMFSLIYLLQIMDLLNETSGSPPTGKNDWNVTTDNDEILNSPNDTIVEQLGVLNVAAGPATSTSANSENVALAYAYGTISGLPWPPTQASNGPSNKPHPSDVAGISRMDAGLSEQLEQQPSEPSTNSSVQPVGVDLERAAAHYLGPSDDSSQLRGNELGQPHLPNPSRATTKQQRTTAQHPGPMSGPS